VGAHIRLRRSLHAIAGALLLVAAIGPTGVGAAQASRTAVCHYDKAQGTYVPITVSGNSSHLPKGDYLPDAGFGSTTIYAIAYTNVDGVAGYSAANCDVVISAFIEYDGSAGPTNGDRIVFGRQPTAFDAPYGFTAISGGPFTGGPGGCDTAGIDVLISGGGSVSYISHTDRDELYANLTGISLQERDWMAGTDDDLLGPSIAHRADPSDNRFTDVDLFLEGICEPA
jgi:hypothetical protein